MKKKLMSILLSVFVAITTFTVNVVAEAKTYNAGELFFAPAISDASPGTSNLAKYTAYVIAFDGTLDSIKEYIQSKGESGISDEDLKLFSYDTGSASNVYDQSTKRYFCDYDSASASQISADFTDETPYVVVFYHDASGNAIEYCAISAVISLINSGFLIFDDTNSGCNITGWQTFPVQKTVADIIGTVDGFPTSTTSTAPGNAWKNENGKGMYINTADNKLYSDALDLIGVNQTVIKNADGNYSFTGTGGTITLIMNGGKLSGVKIEGISDPYEDYNGTYAPLKAYPVYVNGIQVTDNNKDDVLGNGNGEIKYTPAEGSNKAVLTILKDCEISGLECNTENLIITSGDKPVTLTTAGPIKLGKNGESTGITIKGSSSTNTLTIKPKQTAGKNTFRPIAIRSGNTLNLLEGVILTGSNLVDNGGGMINVASNAVLNMNGAIIEDCHVTTDDYDNASSIKGRGGAIYVAANGTFNMTGGEIRNCSATVAGGAIYSVGTVNITRYIADGKTNKITGCSVSGLEDPKDNKVKAKGGAIYILEPGTLTVVNAEISNNTIGDSNSDDMRGGGVYLSANALLNAGAGAVIQNNKHYDGTIDNIYLAGAVAEVEDIIAGNAIPYRSLKDALAAAAADTFDVVRLLADVDTTEDINVGDQVILDLNHHTVNTTGTVTNKGVINLYNENADIIDYLLYNVPGAYGAGEELKLPNDTNPEYIVPEGTFMTTEVGSSPNYQEFDVAVFDGTLEWNTDVKKGTQLNVTDDLALGGDIIAPTDDNDKETNVKATNLKLNDDVTIGSNNEEAGTAVLTVESYDSIDGSHVKGTINANGHKIVLNKTGVLFVSTDVNIDESILTAGVDGMMIGKEPDSELGVYIFTIGSEHHYTNNPFTVDEGYNKNLEFVTDAETWEENDVTIKVDGKVLDPSKYDLAYGSLHITLHGDYIKTLSAGKHTLTTIVTGYATINQDFYIKGKPSPSPTPYIVPNTSVR